MTSDKLTADALRKSEPTAADLAKISRNPIYLVIDEVLDTYNIGSMFRLADATAMEKIYLCGNMEYPPSIKIHRSSVGTDNWVPWEKKESTLETVTELKSQGIQIIAVEQDKTAIPYWELDPTFPVALVVGHETTGVRKEVLEIADMVVELPMLGINNSFNVWGSAAVVAYSLVTKLARKS